MSVKCKECKKDIKVGGIYGKTYYDPNHPNIDIGPYCSDCMGNIRICDNCKEPKVLEDITGKGPYHCIETCMPYNH